MMDIVKKNGDRIRIDELSRRIGCPIVEISALKMTGIDEAAQAATEAARSHKTAKLQTFSATVENVISDIEKIALQGVPAVQKRWYAVKVFERDEKVLARLKLSTDTLKK